MLTCYRSDSDSCHYTKLCRYKAILRSGEQTWKQKFISHLLIDVVSTVPKAKPWDYLGDPRGYRTDHKSNVTMCVCGGVGGRVGSERVDFLC